MTTYSIWQQGARGDLVPSGDLGAFTLGTVFQVSSSVALTGVWFYSGANLAAGATLPTETAIYDVGTTAFVAGTHKTSVSWSGAARSGWVKVSYDGSVTLQTGHTYKVVVFGNGVSTTFFDDSSGYWLGGQPGGSGITDGPLTAPSSATAVSLGADGQAVYNSGGTIAYPTQTVSGFDWGVDVEVSAGSGTVSGPAANVSVVALVGTATATGAPTGITQTIFGQGTPGQIGDAGTSTGTFTGNLASQFTMLSSAPLTGIWYYSMPGAANLPSSCGVFDGATQASVQQNLSPTWSGAAGSGWVKCTFDGSVTLDTRAGGYLAVIHAPGGNFAFAGATAENYPLFPVKSGPFNLTKSFNDSNSTLDGPTTNASTTNHFYVDVEVTAPVSAGFRAGCGVGGASQPQTFQPQLTIPGSVKNNDLMVVGVNLFGFTGDAGFALHLTPSLGGSTWTQLGSTLSMSSGTIMEYGAVWVRQATAADAGTTLTFSYTGTPGTNQKWWDVTFAAYAGLSAAGVLFATSDTPGATSPATIPSVVSAVNGSWGVLPVLASPNTGGNITVSSPPSGFTFREISARYEAGPTGIIADTNGSVGAAGTTVGGSGVQLTSSTDFNWNTLYTLVFPPLASSNVSGLVSNVNVAAPVGTAAGSAGSINISGAAATVAVTAFMGMAIGFAGTDGNSITTYNIASPENDTGNTGAQTLRVLNPPSPSGSYSHSFLWALTVSPGQDATFGDPLANTVAAGWHNQYNVTILQLGYPVDPWYADNPGDPTTRQETYIKEVRAWVASALHVSGPTEKHYLIGFSKSGMGGQDLILRNPTLWDKVVSWDFPGSDTTAYDRFGSDSTEVYGTNANFLANYELSQANLTAWMNASDFATRERIWIGGFNAFQTDLTDYHNMLNLVGILHEDTYAVSETHAWDSDWMAAGLAWMYSNPIVTGQVAAVAVAALAGTATSNSSVVTGLAARVTVTAPAGTTFPPPTSIVVDAEVFVAFRAYTSLTAQATMEFEAGLPVQLGLTTIASDPWTSMYPG